MADFDNSNRGVLFKNDRKEKDSHPDYRGKGNYHGKDFEISVWVKKDRNGKSFMSLSFKEPYQKPEALNDLGSDWD